MNNPKEWAVGGFGLVEVGVLPVLLGQLEQHASISALGEGQGTGNELSSQAGLCMKDNVEHYKVTITCRHATKLALITHHHMTTT